MNRGKKNKKAKGQKEHSKLRASERFGFDLSKAGYERLCQLTRHSLKNEGTVEVCSLRVSVVRVEFENEILLVVYDKHRKTVATILPKEDPRYQLLGRE